MYCEINFTFQSDLNIVASFDRKGQHIYTGNAKGRVSSCFKALCYIHTTNCGHKLHVVAKLAVVKYKLHCNQFIFVKHTNF